jgi:mono/diheme cytochrome c family protein
VTLSAVLNVIVSPIVAVTEAEPSETTEIGIGAVVLTVAIAAFLIWVAYLVTTARRKRRAEETPKNLQPWLSDDELENNRLTRVLSSAVVSAAVLAILLPVYYMNETDRQEHAADNFDELYVEEGEKWFVKFECISCHSADGSGGAGEHVEVRSGLTVQWAAPSLNDVFFRYSEEEIRFWIEFGRSGTPMPPNGLEGGGAMTVQEVDQVLAFLHEIQLDQSEAFGKVEGAVSAALRRIETGAQQVARAVFEQQAVRDDLDDFPGQFEVIEEFPDRVRNLLAGRGTCTDDSAALVGSRCRSPGADFDRDGISDEAERALTEDFAAVVDTELLVRRVSVDAEGQLIVEFVQNVNDYEHLYGVALDPSDPFSMEDATGPIADLATVDAFLRELDAAHLTLRVISERTDRFIEAAELGLAALEESLAAEKWHVDFAQVAADTGLTLEDAERAVGLFNAYCARCHTAGYSAGVAFEQEPGSGAWAPALAGGRSEIQFPDIEDQIDFVIRGSVLAEAYGVNGIGRGWMPGFGQVLSEEDIRLIVTFERSL